MQKTAKHFREGLFLSLSLLKAGHIRHEINQLNGKCWHYRNILQNSRFFFLKSVKKSLKRDVRVAREPHTPVSPLSPSLFSAPFQTFCLTARAYLNTQKYGLFCSLLP